MRNLKLIIVILIIALVIVMIRPIISEAAMLDDVISQADDFETLGEGEAASGPDEQAIKNISDEIYVVLLTIAVIVAVIVGGILGIQFIIASAEDKAKVKEAMIPYIIGCIVSFGAFGIWKAVVLVLN